MASRYIQTSVDEQTHKEFKNFAFNHDPQLSLGQLVEIGVRYYIDTKRREGLEKATQAEGDFQDKQLTFNFQKEKEK